jgi:ubiquitin thioesterase ZRANB1
MQRCSPTDGLGRQQHIEQAAGGGQAEKSRYSGGSNSSGCGSPTGGESTTTNNLQYEKRLRQLRRRMRETDWAWVSACMGVVEGDACPVEAYLNSGGDPTRKLTAAECSLLARPGVYEIGHTLVHLAVKLHRSLSVF